MALSVPLYTVHDLAQFPDDGNRYELLDGVLLVTPQAGAPHQVVTSRIHGELVLALQKPGIAHVVGPGAVVRKPRTQLQPDILVYPSQYSPRVDWPKIKEHWLAVEVLSRSSRTYDREFKKDAYFALGVRQVWLVDWREASVEVWTSRRSHRVARRTLRWLVAGVAVTIDLTDVFAGLD